ncbi:MAG TPA: UDP-2,3-diacylglucosamine diphosphatase LpxI [Phycisphaerae bacterium]|nr:UDP-2,3-diacylglucosamine diphosphatase LpxI [Phycisphaerae bacterium]
MHQPDASTRDSIGIIAGAGRFPFLVAAGARRAGCRVDVIAIRGLADPGLAELADRFRWSGVVRLGQWIRTLRRWGDSRAILAGSVRKSEMYGRLRLLRYLPDWTSIRLWFFTVADKRNDTLLRAVADELANHDITLENSVQYCPEDMAPEGVLTARKPSAAQLEDLEFGWKLAKELGRLDIGQSIAVKETEVIAVEAIEGTDRMIERAGQLCKSGGWTLIKVAKPGQDMRFDVPTVGPDTIANLKRNGANMLVVEAGTTLIVDRDKLIQAADRAGIVVVGHRDPNTHSEPRP